MKIRPNCLVEIAYKIFHDGELFEDSDSDGTLTYLVGSDDLPAPLQEALMDKSEGDEVDIETAEGDVFGPYDLDGIVPILRADFPEDVELKVGNEIVVTFEDDDGSSEELPMRVHEINGDTVMLDGNHPLAGKPLRVWMRVESIGER